MSGHTPNPADEYAVQLARLVTRVRYAANAMEEEGQPRPDRLTGQVDTVAAARRVVDILTGSARDLIGQLIVAAVRADHASARLTPAELIDRAATALEDSGMIGTTGKSDAGEHYADVALRGAGVIR